MRAIAAYYPLDEATLLVREAASKDAVVMRLAIDAVTTDGWLTWTADVPLSLGTSGERVPGTPELVFVHIHL